MSAKAQVKMEDDHRQLHEQLTVWRVPRVGPNGGGKLSLLGRTRLMRNEFLKVLHAQRYEIDRLKRLLKEAGVDPRA